MKKFIAYLKLFYAYIQTPKGRYDFFDYLRAILMIGFVSGVIGGILKMWLDR